MKFKKTLLTLALLTAALTTACNTEEKPQLPTLDIGSTGAEITARISEINEVSMETENLIEKIYIDYSEMDDYQKGLVENLDKLLEAREELAKLYNTEEKDGSKIDRSKILTGVYCFNTRTEERLQWAKDAGIDIIIGAPYDMGFLDLCQKYEIGTFLSYLPGWWGDNGQHGGTLINERPSGVYNPYAESFTDHPAIWAMDVGDEPSALDFPHFGVIINEAKTLFPNQLIFLNLYPNYADKLQQGTDTYEEHIQIYSDSVDTDYISFDFYNISVNDDTINKNSSHGRNSINALLLRHVENLRIVANVCRETERDVWTVIQGGASSYLNSDTKAVDYLSKGQAQTQIYTCLAFGSQAFYWACWEDGWNNPQTNMVNSKGERTESYYSVKAANEKLNELSPVYMKYKNTDTAFFGNTEELTDLSYGYIKDKRETEPAETFDFMAHDDNTLDQDTFTDITVTRKDAIILAGSFIKNSGEGSAMMFANVSDFCAYGNLDDEFENHYNTKVQFKVSVPDAKVYIYHTEYTAELKPNEEGVYTFSLMNTQGAFVTVHSEPETVEEQTEK